MNYKLIKNKRTPKCGDVVLLSEKLYVVETINGDVIKLKNFHHISINSVTVYDVFILENVEPEEKDFCLNDLDMYGRVFIHESEKIFHNQKYSFSWLRSNTNQKIISTTNLDLIKEGCPQTSINILEKIMNNE